MVGKNCKHREKEDLIGMNWHHNLIWHKCYNLFYKSSKLMSKQTNGSIKLRDKTRDLMAEEIIAKTQNIITITNITSKWILNKIISSSKNIILRECHNLKFNPCLNLIISLYPLKFIMSKFLSINCLFHNDIFVKLRK